MAAMDLPGVEVPVTASSWVTRGPSGDEAAYLLLTTTVVDPVAAQVAMSHLAQALGLRGPGTMGRSRQLTASIAESRLSIAGGEVEVAQSLSADWVRAAGDRGTMALVIGLDPMPAGCDPQRYAVPERTSRLFFAFVPVRAAPRPDYPADP